jgi:hypothetical protein
MKLSLLVNFLYLRAFFSFVFELLLVED